MVPQSEIGKQIASCRPPLALDDVRDEPDFFHRLSCSAARTAGARRCAPHRCPHFCAGGMRLG